MAIYDISEHAEKEAEADLHVGSHHRFSGMSFSEQKRDEVSDSKGHLFSTIAARLFFFILLIADLCWSAWSILLFSLGFFACLCTAFRFKRMKRFVARRYLSLKRACVCALSLLAALFSPALGMMFACSYFLMYDKKGIDEVVPSVLKDQLREFFTP